MRLLTDSALSAASWQLLRPRVVVPDAVVGPGVVDEQLAVERVVEPVAVVDAEQPQPHVLLAFPAFAVIEAASVVVEQPDPGRLVGLLLAEARAVALLAAAVAAVDDELAAAVAAAAVVVAAGLAVAVAAAVDDVWQTLVPAFVAVECAEEG